MMILSLEHSDPYSAICLYHPISFSPTSNAAVSLPTPQPIPHSYTRKLARPHSRDQLQIGRHKRKSDLSAVQAPNSTHYFHYLRRLDSHPSTSFQYIKIWLSAVEPVKCPFYFKTSFRQTISLWHLQLRFTSFLSPCFIKCSSIIAYIKPIWDELRFISLTSNF
jgi:hypothetical protein